MTADNGRPGLNGRTAVEDSEGPKTPRIGVQVLPSTTLRIPYLTRRASSILSAPESRPASSLRSFRFPFAPASPRAATPLRQHQRRASDRTIFPRVHQSQPRRLVGVDSAEDSLTQPANLGRRRRQRAKKPERTCVLEIKNNRIRAKLASCTVSGIFLSLVLTVYIAMSLSDQTFGQGFHIVLIIIILLTTTVFCHSLIRLCMMLAKPPPEGFHDLERQAIPEMYRSGGYAEPVRPFQVALARDEEAAGIESEATKVPPPAYGLWKETVRVDPNRIFWKRNSAPPVPEMPDMGPTSRPPSYASENGFDYAVEELPIHVTPGVDVSLPIHPSERGRLGSVKPSQYQGQRSTHKLVVMSSLSRRACYKCGNVGHYAEVCSSAERLCYNCKQPGHESNGCPLPRTTEAKQCYHCQGLGHVQADCPTLRLSGAGTSGRCYNCGLPGHLARSCPAPAGPGPIPGVGRGLGAPRGGFGGGYAPRGAFAGGPRPATCYKCGGPNHFARDCQAQAMKCYACGKLGHISRDCTAPNGGPLNTAGKTCYQCGEAGHISRDCPQKGANGDFVGDIDPGVAAVAPIQPIA
ncbi:uncharacterized protein L3040_000385 [Drepanopeziza brunnea f. sp. 'multigermtubi']|nr:hypothetical protein L3040_000385 [Drepanopeziza brunnea f. sp. 'multigermtubi']